MENKQETMQVLVMLKAAYPRMQFGRESVMVYQMSLADIDPPLLRAAVLRHVSISKWFPTIAELRQHALELILEAEGHLSAPEAWGLVMREVRRVGHWGSPNIPPAASQALDAIGGWKLLCMSENNIADRARFLEAYKLLCKREAEKIQQIPAATSAQETLTEGKQTIDSAVTGLLASMNKSV